MAIVPAAIGAGELAPYVVGALSTAASAAWEEREKIASYGKKAYDVARHVLHATDALQRHARKQRAAMMVRRAQAISHPVAPSLAAPHSQPISGPPIRSRTSSMARGPGPALPPGLRRISRRSNYLTARSLRRRRRRRRAPRRYY